jgi:mannose-6-phosphate isomerase
MVSTQRVFPLKGVVQHYSWGGYLTIPNLLGIENKEQKPFAEYWLGAHPNHPSTINGASTTVSELIRNDQQHILGASLSKKFSSLPFLLKVLDVRQMLSIQVHPDKASAEKGFDAENKMNIPVNAPNRNYKDNNHKPEMMAALSEFWLLHGFKKESFLEMTLDAVPELRFLKDIFEQKGYRGLYEEVMLMEQGKVNDILSPLIERILPLFKKGELQKDKEDFWAAKAAVEFCKDGNYDRGIFSIYFFNLVQLNKGEGIFQGAGLPHAYLEGQNIELMSNSDNVLRAGLTEKHIDVQELMKHVKFEATIPQIISPGSGHHKIFESPAEEFELQQYELPANSEETIQAETSEILLLMDGQLELKTGEEEMLLKKGDAVLVAAGTLIALKPVSQINLFRATVPFNRKN